MGDRDGLYLVANIETAIIDAEVSQRMVGVDCQWRLKVANCFLKAANSVERATQVDQDIEVVRCQ